MLYFDNAATTMPSKNALQKAEIFNNEKYFNPSALYKGGLNCAKEIKCAKEIGADYIELHTGKYSNTSGKEREVELERLKNGAIYATEIGLKVNAGHGIDYDNIDGILTIPYLHELNIGHSIVGRAIYVGMEKAVAEMIDLMKDYKL